MSDSNIAFPPGNASQYHEPSSHKAVDNIVELRGSVLYSGCDLSAAYERSRIPSREILRTALTRGGRASRLIDDLQNLDPRHVLAQSFVVDGVERDTGQLVRIGFSGTGRINDYFARALLGGSDYKIEKTNRKRLRDVDMIVADHSLSNLLLARPAFKIPPWVRQQRPIEHTWEHTLTDLGAKLRSEIRRILRGSNYRATLSAGATAIRSYYLDLHKPYITDRFGDEAILSTESAFVRQRKHMVRLDLLQGTRLVAASLLEVRPKVLAVRSSAMHPQASGLPGRADALDYFALLIGQQLHCETLDFGLSRPHAEDGALLYKLKWGATVSQVQRSHKANICVSPVRRNEAVLSILRRNLFLQESHNGLAIRVLFDAAAATMGSKHLTTLRRASRVAPVVLGHPAGNLPPKFPDLSSIAASPIHPNDDPLAIAIQAT